MDNYIVINGKKAELTKEQLEQLGIKTDYFNPFARVDEGDVYYTINGVCPLTEAKDGFDDNCFNKGNYFNNKEFAQQIYLHVLLNCKLLRFSYVHKANVDWTDSRNKKYYISYDNGNKEFVILSTFSCKSFDICFPSHFLASKAYNEIVKPFMEENPDFVW